MNQADRIKAAMQHKGMSNSDLARACGVSSAAVGQWLNNDTKAPKAENIFKIASATGASAEWLTTGKGRMVADTAESRGLYRVASNVEPAPAMEGKVPMIRWKNAAAWKEISQAEVEAAALEWLPKPTNCSPEAFALRVVGESMSPRYPPGQIIFIDPAADPRSGDDVVATMEDDQAIFKRLVEEPGGERMLKAINPAWPEPYQPASDACRIIGVVMADMHMRPD